MAELRAERSSFLAGEVFGGPQGGLGAVFYVDFLKYPVYVSLYCAFTDEQLFADFGIPET